MSRKGDFRRYFSSAAKLSELWLLAPTSYQHREGAVGQKEGLCCGKWLWRGRYLLNPFSPVDIKIIFILTGLQFPFSPVACSCCCSPSEALQLKEVALWSAQISMGASGGHGWGLMGAVSWDLGLQLLNGTV